MITTTEKNGQKQTSSKKIEQLVLQESLNNSLESLDLRPLYIRRGLTEKNMHDIYVMGFGLYESQKFNEALLCFKLMTLLNWSDKKAWLGSAACLEVTKQYSSAIVCYTAAAMTDPDDPMPLLRSFRCYLENHDTKNALVALDAAIEAAEKQSDLYSDLKDQAIKLKEILLK